MLYIQSQTKRKRIDFTLTTCQSTNATETRTTRNNAQYFIFYLFPNFSMNIHENHVFQCLLKSDFPYRN